MVSSDEHRILLTEMVLHTMMLALNQRAILAALYPITRADMKPIIKSSAESTEKFLIELKELSDSLQNELGT